jgi:hypothetical protein
VTEASAVEEDVCMFTGADWVMGGCQKMISRSKSDMMAGAKLVGFTREGELYDVHICSKAAELCPQLGSRLT